MPNPTADGYDSDTDFPFKISPLPKTANKGGMSVENQGRVLPDRTTHEQMGKAEVLPEQLHWSFSICIAKSVYDSRSNQAIIEDFKLAAPSGDYGLRQISFVIGNNEQVTLEDDPNYDQDEAVKAVKQGYKQTNLNLTAVDSYGIPALFQFSYWQANWKYRETDEPAPIDEVRIAYAAIKARQPGRARNLRLYERARSFYPYGQMRSALYSSPETSRFFTEMQQRVGVRATPCLFLLNQDADYIELNIQPRYYTALGDGLDDSDAMRKLRTTYTELTSAPDKTLLDRYNEEISQHYSDYRRYPRFMGGGHIYSSVEEKTYLERNPSFNELDHTACQEWTRFGSEMGNAIKHLIGLYNSYPLYFHEPNTMLKWQSAPITFGDKSEMNDYFREQLRRDSKDTRSQAKFHAAIVLSSAQRRSDKPFTVRYSGQYEDGQFLQWDSQDIRALQNMSQEIFTSNEWANVICTAFVKYKTKTPANDAVQILKDNWNIPNKDARKVIARLYNLYDPHHLAYRYDCYSKQTISWDDFCKTDQESFLIEARKSRGNRKSIELNYSKSSFEHVIDSDNYNTLLPEADGDLLLQIKSLLTYIYGAECATNIIHLAQQTGELRRNLFTKVLRPTEAIVELIQEPGL